MFLALDLGTTAVKAALFDENLRRLGLVIREVQLLTPQAGIVELPAGVYWDKAVACVRALMAETGASPNSLLSVTCATQGETLIPLGRQGEPLHRAVVWLDARAAEEAGALSRRYTKEAFYGATGIPEISPYCPIAKLLWFKNHQGELYRQTAKFALLEDYIVYRLTGRAVSNPALLCTTGYFDINANGLWANIFRQTGLDAGKIPEIAESGTVVGSLRPQAASELGLPQGIAVVAGAMDQAASVLGAGGSGPGFLSETTGTCLAVGLSTTAPGLEPWSPVPVYAHAQQEVYLKIFIEQTAGILLKWFKDEFCADLTGSGVYGKLDALAADAPPLCHGLVLAPRLTGTPARPSARGAFLGVSLKTGRGCFIRAILEGTGYMLKESLERLGAGGAPVHSMGGGAKSGLWGQIKADICQTPVLVPAEEETALLGAAMLGAVALQQFPNLEACAQQVRIGKTFQPNRALAALYGEGYEHYKAACETVEGRL